jgi:hypothetical protein
MGTCGRGLHCVAAACVCDAASCRGCCAARECMGGTTPLACGGGGTACVACAADNLCTVGMCTPVPKPAKVVLFGGTGIGLPNDTWTFDGAIWTPIKTAGPPGRYSAAMATLPGAQARVVLFGGLGERGFLSDTWTFDGTRWVQINVTGPAASSSHAMASMGDKVVLFDGGTWTFDGTTWKQVMTNPTPQSTSGWSMAPLGDKVVLFGGAWNQPAGMGDAWVFDGANWSKLAAQGPTARSFANMALLADGVDVLHGGLAPSAGIPAGDLTDTWLFDGTRWTLVAANSAGPSRRFGAAMAALGNAAHKVVLFGGETADGLMMGETWTFDGATWTLVNTTGPAGRYDANMATLP